MADAADALNELERALGHTFTDRGHLRLAMTHSSWANEHPELPEHNERLEFLGDAVLELAISEELFKRFPAAHEGQLTRIRSRLVKEDTLAGLARGLNLHALLRLGKGEDSQGGRERASLLADALEALFGGVFLDAGYEPAKACILGVFAGMWPENPELPKVKDYKTHLQEVTQHLHRERPVYAQVGTHGPDHAKVYEVAVTLPDGQCFVGSGQSLKKAEQKAASLAIEHLAATESTGA